MMCYSLFVLCFCLACRCSKSNAQLHEASLLAEVTSLGLAEEQQVIAHHGNGGGVSVHGSSICSAPIGTQSTGKEKGADACCTAMEQGASEGLRLAVRRFALREESLATRDKAAGGHRRGGGP